MEGKGRSERGRGIERERAEGGGRWRGTEESSATCILTAMSLQRGCPKWKLDCVVLAVENVF